MVRGIPRYTLKVEGYRMLDTDMTNLEFRSQVSYLWILRICT